VAGYLAVWSAIGVAAYGLLEALHRWVPADNTTALRVGATILIAAGVYQLTPLKSICLRHCRSPLSVLMHHARLLGQGHTGPMKVGVLHGAYCVGCCWSLMVVLILLGLMNLVWMGVVAAVVLVEKVIPRGEMVSRGVGVALGGIGAALMVWPTALPALT
jgi:predicted metal-binding membrane protein